MRDKAACGRALLAVHLQRLYGLTALIFACLSPHTAFAAADVLYDFGVQDFSPKVTSTNPALLAHCESQAMTGFSLREVDFKIRDAGEVQTSNADKNRNYGSVDFGMCERLLRWFSYGIHFNASALSFRFETQNQDDPLVFPYNKDTLPIGSGGIGLRLTEQFSAGFAWKMVQSANIRAFIPVEDLTLQTAIDVEVRPVISWLLGGSYKLAGQEFYYSYSPEIRGDLDFDFDVSINLPFVAYDLGLIQMQTAISYIPVQNRVGVLGEWRGYEYDLGVVQNQWSKLDDPFLNVDTFGNLDIFLFDRQRLNLQDTYEPYLVIRRQMTKNTLWTAGYSYRRNPVREASANQPLVGADLHSFKFGAEHAVSFLNRQFILGGDVIVGVMDGSQTTSRTQSLEGHFATFQGFLRVPLGPEL